MTFLEKSASMFLVNIFTSQKVTPKRYIQQTHYYCLKTYSKVKQARHNGHNTIKISIHYKTYLKLQTKNNPRDQQTKHDKKQRVLKLLKIKC